MDTNDRSIIFTPDVDVAHNLARLASNNRD
jgi:hypothetical protein